MNRYDDRARLVFHFAREEGAKLGHTMIGPEHLLLGLMREGGTAYKVLSEFGATHESLLRQVEKVVGRGNGLARNETAAITPKARRVMELAGSEARSLGSNVIATEHILLGVIREGEGIAYRILQNLTRDVDTVRWRILAATDKGSKSESAKTPFLEEYARDLTKEASNGKLDPVIGRSEEIWRIVQILSRRSKNNPLLIGEPGVGKTAVVEALAQTILEGNVPPNLIGTRVVTIDLSNVVAGTKYRGEFEERLRNIISELKIAKVIAFIDEIHTLVGAGGAEGTLDAANILKPPLSRGEVQVIGATTASEYQRYIERDAALERRFQSVIILEPSPTQTLSILEGLRERYEQHHGVVIPQEILSLSIRYGERSLPGRNFPDKAIDLIDEASARTRLNKSLGLPVKELEKGTPVVSREDIEAVLDSWGGIYTDELNYEKLVELELTLEKSVVGQGPAIKALLTALRRVKVGLGGHSRVSASFLFLGPSGVGKTFLAKQLATQLFGSERALIRLDMSEYQEAHATSKLIGAPPGYIGYDQGGRLTESVRRRPFSVVLLDEIEKAHPEVYNLFLQILDDGRLTDGLGRTIDFRRVILIMTSNTGFNIGGPMGFQELEPDIETPLKAVFAPEFIDRLDEVIGFENLDKVAFLHITEQMLVEIQNELKSRDINITFSGEVASFLVNKMPKVNSARAIRGVVREYIEDPLVLELMINGSNEEIIITVDNEEVIFARPVAMV